MKRYKYPPQKDIGGGWKFYRTKEKTYDIHRTWARLCKITRKYWKAMEKNNEYKLI